MDAPPRRIWMELWFDTTPFGSPKVRAAMRVGAHTERKVVAALRIQLVGAI